MDSSWIETIAATLFGALLGLGVSTLERRSARRHDTEKLRREKAELALVEISRLEAATLADLQWLGTPKPLLDQLPEPSRFEFATLDSIINLYFPEAAPVLDSYYEETGASSAGINSGDVDLANIPEITRPIRFQNGIRTLQLARELREAVRDTVRPVSAVDSSPSV